ncbi:MAG: hypothetical protein MK212_05930 [Saprospiraceae bacterium]|nr:hypothetical protein [Saprospiraceae bacterium]
MEILTNMTSSSFFRNIIPFRKESYRSLQDPDTLRGILEHNTEPRRLLRWGGASRNTKLFEGKIEKESFKIYRILTYRNSFRPTISGQLRVSKDGGSDLNLSFRLEFFVYIFLILWTGILIPSFVFLFPEMWQKLGLGSIWAIGGLFLFFGVVLAAFHYERKKASDLLTKLLSLEIASPPKAPNRK